MCGRDRKGVGGKDRERMRGRVLMVLKFKELFDIIR
jgi:hypothetical protein